MVFTEEELEEIRCLRAVAERILRVMDEGLFVDYQLEKWGKIIKEKDIEKLIQLEDSIENPENKEKLKKGIREKLKATLFMPDGKTPRCTFCGKAMTNLIKKTADKDGSAIEEPNQYEWVCDCPLGKKIILSVG